MTQLFPHSTGRHWSTARGTTVNGYASKGLRRWIDDAISRNGGSGVIGALTTSSRGCHGGQDRVVGCGHGAKERALARLGTMGLGPTEAPRSHRHRAVFRAPLGNVAQPARGVSR